MRFFSRVFLPFLLLGYIAVETYLKLKNVSLCEEIGCKLAGELLRFDHIYLNYLGIFALFSLLVFGYLSLKSKFFKTLFFTVLYAAIAFEATILSYQFIANPEPCIFCLGIFFSLLLIALFSRIKNFIVILATVLAIILGLNILTIPKNEAYVSTSGIYLIESASCPHCKKVKTYFAQNKIDYTPISANEVNVRAFLKFVDITTIPVLLLKDKAGITLLKGDKKIIAHFETQKSVNPTETLTVNTTATQSSVLGELSGFLDAEKDEGCTLTIVQTDTCADDNKSHTAPD